MISIPAKQLATLFYNKPAAMRNALYKIKFPNDDDVKAGSAYHARARKFVYAYHNKNHNVSWLEDKESQFRTEASLLSASYQKSMLISNANGINDYIDYFSNRNFTDMSRPKLSLAIGNISIGLKTDFYGTHRNRPCLVRLEFSRATLTDKQKAMLGTMHQLYVLASEESDLDIPPTGVKLFDIPHGRSINGRKPGLRFSNDIKAHCDNITAIWNTLTL